jgi:hypothetical protein
MTRGAGRNCTPLRAISRCQDNITLLRHSPNVTGSSQCNRPIMYAIPSEILKQFHKFNPACDMEHEV